MTNYLMHMQMTDYRSVAALYVVFATHEHTGHTAEDPATNELILDPSSVVYDHSHDDHYRLQTEHIKLLMLNRDPSHQGSVEPYVFQDYQGTYAR